MRKIIAAALAAAFVFGGCSAELPHQSSETSQPCATTAENTQERYVPLNYKDQVGMWLPYVRFPDYMQSRSEEQFRKEVVEILEDAAAEGVNTVYFHAHPMGDAYYRSVIFPKGEFLDGSYDPLAIVVDEAHKRDISVHAWINPLRLQTDEQMRALPEDYIIKKWIAAGEPFVKNVNGRWYLDPAYPETRQLLTETAAEILDGYKVDGLHIDDYFYPTADTDFDSEAFAESGESDLAQWRMDNVSSFVKALYDTVKSRDERLLFGISPQANISADYDSQFADVRRWAGEQGFCDYIVPQIYFGFNNENSPFLTVLQQWEDLARDSGVSLVIGLAPYKLGREDKWAGKAAELEWINDPDIISKQIAAVKESSADGYALYY
jgi:uncharacterized lipoprotein YddW (UPF0748 family)